MDICYLTAGSYDVRYGVRHQAFWQGNGGKLEGSQFKTTWLLNIALYLSGILLSKTLTKFIIEPNYSGISCTSENNKVTESEIIYCNNTTKCVGL